MSRSSVMSYISIELPTICFVVCSSLYEGIGSIDLERETGVEPATSSLARKHSTTELLPLTSLSITGQGADGQRFGSLKVTRNSHKVRLCRELFSSGASHGR
jgi:hypothetical protein